MSSSPAIAVSGPSFVRFRSASPLVALIAVPVVAALAGGFGLGTAKFVVAGIQQIGPVAAMFVFAILYFGIITDAGGLLSHAAIVAREYGIPGVVGTREATDLIADGTRVRVDGDKGEVTVLG